jgi:hypothetical protein
MTLEQLEDFRRRRRAARRRYENRKYQVLRQALLKDMGECCAKCGSYDRPEFDHPYGRDWDIKAVNRITRLTIYRREWLAGRLRILCKSCNQFDWHTAERKTA